MAEGLELLRGKQEFALDLAKVTELWRHGSVVRSWLLDLTAEALKDDQELNSVAPYVPDSGEGRWTMIESVDQGVAAPVLTLALQMRFNSQNETGYGYRLLSTMRNAFGGHAVKKAGGTKMKIIEPCTIVIFGAARRSEPAQIDPGIVFAGEGSALAGKHGAARL